MATITILDDEFVSMWHYPLQGIIHHQFHKHIWGEAFRNTLNKGAELFETRRATKWLSDDRHNCALSKEDSEWAIQTWFPRVLRAGWKHWAIVLPKHVIGQMNMKRFVEEYSERGVQVRVFDDPVDAMGWLDIAATTPR